MNKIRLTYSLPCLILSIILPGITIASWQQELRQKVENNTIPSWMQKQIDADLDSFSQGITREMIDSTQRYSKNIGHFTLINRKVKSTLLKHTETLGRGFSPGGAAPVPFVDRRRMIIHKALTDLASTVTVPDVELLIILCDGTVDTIPHAGPLFAFSKHETKNTNVIAFPDPDVLSTHATLEKEVLLGNTQWPWHTKLKKALWRGGVNDLLFFYPDHFQKAPRFKLITFSQQHPELLDARFVKLDGCARAREYMEANAFSGNHVDVKDHLQYAYQIQIDGWTAGWARMYWQLMGNSLMLKQTSDNIQWYYHALTPYEHYVPLAHDVSDIAEKMDWAEKHEEEVQRIISNANEFARNNLKYADILYYMYLLLSRYATLQQFTLPME